MNEYKIITLSGFGWTAEILPLRGMNTLRLSAGDRSILRSPETPYSIGGRTFYYGCPIVLPGNRTEDATFTFDGKIYYLPLNEPRLHNNNNGQLNRMQFRVLEQSPTSVTATYLNLGVVFPFPFRITTHYFIDESGFHQEFTFENTGKSDMPLTFGLYTNFSAPEQFSVPLGKKWVKDDRYIPTGELENLNEAEQKFCTGSPCPSFTLGDYYTSAGTTARLDDVLYTVSDNFNQWLLWNGDVTKGLLSIRPHCGAVNSLNNGIGLMRLKPGQKETFTTWFHLDK